MSDLFEAFNELQNEMSGVTTEQLDLAIKEMREAREEYEARKKESNSAHAEFEKRKYEVIKLLEASGKTKYVVEGFGTASLVVTKSTKVPKDFEAKKQMVDYFRGLGSDAYYSFITVNSRTLNSYINEQSEINPDFKLPGVEQTISSDLRFRKERK